MTETDGKITVVLLVEDEALVRMFAADLLREEAGFKVVEAGNADEALTVLEATPDVEVLVTDVEMPGTLDGFTLARLVNRAWPHIGIVVASGRAAPGDGDLPPGARFIAKPYTPSVLIEAVRAALTREASPIIVPAQEAPVVTTVNAVVPPVLAIDVAEADIGKADDLPVPRIED